MSKIKQKSCHVISACRIVRIGVALYALARAVRDATRSHAFDKGSLFVSRTLPMHTMEITEGTKARRIIMGAAQLCGCLFFAVCSAVCPSCLSFLLRVAFGPCTLSRVVLDHHGHS